MKRIWTLLIIMSFAALPLAAHAEWYAGAGGGVQFPHETEVKTTLGQDVEFDQGWGALGTIGYRYGNGLRSEVEFSYRDADVDSVSLSAVDDGSARVYSAMINTLYDVPVSADFLPYVGLGVGYAHVNYNDVRTINGGIMDDSDNSPAVQGIVGFTVPLLPDIGFFTQYQYQHIFNVDLNTSSGLSADADYASSLITAGLRWNFSVPSMPQVTETTPAPIVPQQEAAPAPAPAPVEEKAQPEIQRYMVFFDFNRSDITIEAADILKKVSDNVKAGKATRLELTGHADRAGADNYNDRLSERRVDNVRRYLIRLGLPANDIITAAKGEHDPLVETKDGERERQNRRVEIVPTK